MADLRAIQLVVELTGPLKKGEKPSYSPLIEYMNAGHPFSPDVYDWFLQALLRSAKLPAFLKFARNPDYHSAAETPAGRFESGILDELMRPLEAGDGPSIAPLVDYMIATHPITPEIYDWILRALQQDPALPAFFTYARQPNRTTSAESVDKHVKAYFRIEELVGQEITEALCDHVRRLYRRGDRRVTRQGQTKKVFILDADGVDRFRWFLGGKVSRDDAIRIAALEMNLSFSSAKQEHYKTLQAIRSAQA